MSSLSTVVCAPRSGLGGVRFAARPRTVALLAVLAAFAVPVATAAAAPAAPASASARPVVVPQVGKLYNVLAVAWWKYALGQPATTNPLTDPTGAHCTAGQSGPVFFLSGTMFDASGVATRECTIRGVKALFFPLLNGFDVHVPDDGLDTPEAVYRDYLAQYAPHASTLTAAVDGVAIGNLNPATSRYYVCAAPVAGCAPSSFSITFPEANLFDIPAGRYAPTVHDGFYLLLAPLKPGTHTVTFGGTGTIGTTPTAVTQRITYTLHVRR
jgi:hypothetical protein